jgi:hypothetical protein
MNLQTFNAALKITGRHMKSNPKLAASIAASIARLAQMSASKAAR